MSRTFTQENFARLTPEERRELMVLQMSPSYGDRSSYLPDDCSGCGACGEPMLGSGWCPHCSRRITELIEKMEGRS